MNDGAGDEPVGGGAPDPEADPSANADDPPWVAPWEDPPDPPETVAVVGAGAVGVTAARDLAAAGAEVTVFEAGEEVGSGSSGRAAGVVYDAFAEDLDARVGRRAMARFRAFSGAGEFELRERPYVLLARVGDDERIRAVERAIEGMARNGVAVERLDGDGVAERFPLRGDDVAVAAVCEGAGSCDPGSYVAAMAEAARRAGATVRTGIRVEVSVEPTGVVVGHDAIQRFDAVLVACGAWTKQVLAAADVPVPLKPYRVQALTGRAPYDGPMVYDATAGAYFRPHPIGLLGGDGTIPEEVDPDEYDPEGEEWFVDDLAETLRHRAGYDLDVARAWAGVCAATPDRDPLLGEVRDGLSVAAGWQGHGFMRAPATAEAVVDAMCGGDGIAAFDPTRFDGDEEFEIVEGMAVTE